MSFGLLSFGLMLFGILSVYRIDAHLCCCYNSFSCIDVHLCCCNDFFPCIDTYLCCCNDSFPCIDAHLCLSESVQSGNVLFEYYSLRGCKIAHDTECTGMYINKFQNRDMKRRGEQHDVTQRYFSQNINTSVP